MRTAIIHDWFAGYAGSERVVEQLLHLLPDAAVHVLCDFCPHDQRQFLGNRSVKTSFIQRLPKARTKFRHYLPLMPLAVEQFDLSAYDVVVSSNHAVAKGVLTGPDQLHVSYVHTPIRYAWDLQHQYLAEAGLDRGIKSAITRLILHYMRLWDSVSATRVDHFVANSKYIARRIRAVYRRTAEVIYPPVDIDRFNVNERKESFYVAASRLVPYKRMPMIAEAFGKMPDKKLVIIGDGPDLGRLKSVARPNVEVLGYQPFDVLRDTLMRARAMVFAAEEDFGITPVEAMACGTPVLAFGRGGACETVVSGKTGLWFDQQTPQSIVDVVHRFERNMDAFDAHAIRRHAESFSPERFRAEFAAMLKRQQAIHADIHATSVDKDYL